MDQKTLHSEKCNLRLFKFSCSRIEIKIVSNGMKMNGSISKEKKIGKWNRKK